MKPLKDDQFGGARARIGYTKRDMADYLEIPVSSYAYKEKDPVRFTDEEKAKLTKLFGWSFDLMNRVFYGGNLPFDGVNTPTNG